MPAEGAPEALSADLNRDDRQEAWTFGLGKKAGCKLDLAEYVALAWIAEESCGKAPVGMDREFGGAATGLRRREFLAWLGTTAPLDSLNAEFAIRPVATASNQADVAEGI